MHRLIALLALTLAGCSPAASRSAAAPAAEAAEGATDPAAVPTALAGAPEPLAVLRLEPYLGVLLTVPVTAGDSTLAYLFDTGGGGTLHTPGAAAAAGCEPFGRVTGFRHNGDAVHARRCPPASVTLDGWPAPARETGVYDLMGLLPEGVPEIGGLVSLRTFDGLPITLELDRRRVIVESPASLRHRVAGLAEVPLRAGRQSGGSMLDVFLPFRAEGGPLWMELDSGNTGPVRIAPHAAAQLGLELSATAPRTITLHLEGFGPVRVEALEKEMIYDGLLNAELLTRLRVTLDLEEMRAWVAPAPSDETGA